MDKKFVVSKADIQNNVKVIKEKVNDARIYAVLKGNAYGMGLTHFAKALYDCEIRYFALTSLDDAIVVKNELCDCSVLLLTPCQTKNDIEAAILNDIVLSVDNLKNGKDIAKIAKEHAKEAKIHIKIDTGMGRYGFLPSQIDEIEKVCRLKNIFVEGIFTHLHSAFNMNEKTSIIQFKEFEGVINALKDKNIEFEVSHICNSTAIFRFPQMHLTAVRAGSALIGRANATCGATNLCKVGNLYGTVTDIRTIPKGHNVGYAALYKAKNDQKIACVNVGYADGVAVAKINDTFRFIDILRYMYNDFKLLFNKNDIYCIYKGQKLKSIGRIGMTNLVLEIDNDCKIKVGDTVEVPVNPIYLSPNIKREYK